VQIAWKHLTILSVAQIQDMSTWPKNGAQHPFPYAPLDFADAGTLTPTTSSITAQNLMPGVFCCVLFAGVEMHASTLSDKESQVEHVVAASTLFQNNRLGTVQAF